MFLLLGMMKKDNSWWLNIEFDPRCILSKQDSGTMVLKCNVFS